MTTNACIRFVLGRCDRALRQALAKDKRSRQTCERATVSRLPSREDLLPWSLVAITLGSHWTFSLSASKSSCVGGFWQNFAVLSSAHWVLYSPDKFITRIFYGCKNWGYLFFSDKLSPPIFGEKNPPTWLNLAATESKINSAIFSPSG